MKHYDVVVIGGGHAGAEAAAASARMGANTLLVTMRKASIGVMSCNPAIGGLGKGHLVREIDALDGLMGKAADYAGIQFRLLNRRKGPAVQGPRTQADRRRYQSAIQRFLDEQRNLSILEGEVVDLKLDPNGVIHALALADESWISAKSIVLTAGTFLNGVIHIGDRKKVGGRIGDQSSVRLAHRLADLALVQGRLKTGTPPRLDGRTIDWSVLDMQPGDDKPTMFSFMSTTPVARQVSCGITATNEKTHDIVRKNIGRSAMYGGHIGGVGPRYCPSIEDKVVRFSDKSEHQVFLEPEGLDDDTIYPNGISTSLPEDVQELYVRTIRGLENVKILQPGYAIEYDFFDPRGLTLGLEVKSMPGLFFAGQINGTTGYEEAAAQGLLAGAGAAARATERKFAPLSRTTCYIGVMVDDLVSRGVTEPYRMFTSRAEYRLTLRADNADQRLTRLGVQAGLVGEERARVFEKKADRLDHARTILEGVTFTPTELLARGLVTSQDGVRRSGYQLLAFPQVTPEIVADLLPQFATLDEETRVQTFRDALYVQYIDRQSRDIAILQRDEGVEIPEAMNYAGLAGMSSELKAKLLTQRPRNLSQAGKIEGMTPAALTLILAHIRRSEKNRASSG